MLSKLLFQKVALKQFTFQLNNFLKLGLALVIISFPFQLNSFVYQAEWGRGFVNSYLSVFISAAEIFLFLTALVFFLTLKRTNRKIYTGSSPHILIVLFSLILIRISSLFSNNVDPVFIFFITVKSLELLLFYLLIVNKILSTQEILRIFIYSMSFQAFLASLELLLQSDLGFQFLGEPQISTDNPHLARFSFLGFEILRAYGTFPHPNVLGGFLCISILSTFLIKSSFKNEWIILITLQLIGLFATFSRSAIIALSLSLLVLGVWHFKQLKEKNNCAFLSLITLFILATSGLLIMRGLWFFKDPAFLERLEGYELSLELFLSHPWGLGFNNYTLIMDQGAHFALMPWEYQPVHNAFLLTLVEMGAQGFLFALFVLIYTLHGLNEGRHRFLSHSKQLRRQIFLATLLAFFVLGSLDHYLLSLEQGRFLLILFFSLASLFAYEALPVRMAIVHHKIELDPK